jgi:hypothetical protein
MAPPGKRLGGAFLFITIYQTKKWPFRSGGAIAALQLFWELKMKDTLTFSL